MSTGPTTDQRSPYDKEEPVVAAQRANNKHLFDHQSLGVFNRNKIQGLFRAGIAKTMGLSDQAIEHAMAPMPASVTQIKQSNMNWPVAALLSTVAGVTGLVGYGALSNANPTASPQSPPVVSVPQSPQGNLPSTTPVPTGDNPPNPNPATPGTQPAPTTPQQQLPKPISWDFRLRWWVEEDGKLNTKSEQLPSTPGRQPDEPPESPSLEQGKQSSKPTHHNPEALTFIQPSQDLTPSVDTRYLPSLQKSKRGQEDRSSNVRSPKGKEIN